MMYSAAQLQQVIEQVLTRLQRRRQQTACLDVAQLRKADVIRLLCQHAALEIVLADGIFLSQLACRSCNDPAVQHLHDALALGAIVSISVHHGLLASLALTPLAALPLRFADEAGRQVHLIRTPVLCYRHIATLSSGWVLIPSETLITPLARETAAVRGITLVKQE